MSDEPGKARSIARSATRIGVLAARRPGPARRSGSTTPAPQARRAAPASQRVRLVAGSSPPVASSGQPPRRPRTAPPRRRGQSRPRSIRSPSSASIAGSTVSDPSTAIATTRIAPSAIDVKTPKPVNSSPARPITTVVPATRIARPTVAEVAASAASAARARATLGTLTPDVEQRVVDADRKTDQDHDRGRRGAVGGDVRDQAERAEGRPDRRQPEQQRHRRGDQRAEREHEDQRA